MPPCLVDAINADVWRWLDEFVTAKNDFYNRKFAPCPYARAAINAGQVGVAVWTAGDVTEFIRLRSIELRDTPAMSTLVMAFPPRVQFRWGMTDFVETLNSELIADDIFLNTGSTKTMASRYPGSTRDAPYFIAVANRLDAVLAGSQALQRTQYYRDWPAEQLDLVVVRRARMAQQFGCKG
jgi:hypothetical protein